MPIKRFSALMAALLLSGCQTATSFGNHAAATLGLMDNVPKTYTASSVSEPSKAGVAVSDEPLAARQGAMALAAGGSAVDAVATMYFTLSVTYPVAAGLGAGGICLVRDAGGQVREFDFLARAPAGGGVNAVPGAVRGFADMQTQYGRLPWQRVVGPGEAYAATGFPISQVLEQRLTAAADLIAKDRILHAEFTEDDKILAAGENTRNLILAQSLSAIRTGGADGFYKGALAARIEEASRAMGGSVDQGELAAQKTTVATPAMRGAIALPNAQTGAGIFAAALMNGLRGNPAALTQATQAALAQFGVSALPRDMGSTSFAAVDAYGQAASCAVTMNGPFGRSAGNTGVQLASAPVGQSGLASAFLAPLIVGDRDGSTAIVGAGGPNGAAAAVNAAMAVAGGRSLGRRGDLRSAGNAPFDTVNAATCDDTSCVALSDPDAHGLGVAADAY